MDKEDGVYTYKGMLFNLKKEENPAICNNGHYAKWDKPVI